MMYGKVSMNSTHLAPYAFGKFRRESPFPAVDPKAHPAPLPVMASGGDDGRCSRSGSPDRDHRRLPGSGTSFSRALPPAR
jgi:hypothetical protein